MPESENRPSSHLNSKTDLPEIDLPVVAMGASAGGLEALQEFFEQTPNNSGVAFVVITHQLPGRISLLPELLAKSTKMQVMEATDGVKLCPNHVYVAPPGGHVAMLHNRLSLMEDSSEVGRSSKLPIDSFFRSLAADKKERAICIVLSGTGTDGTLGLKAIKGESGMAMVQHPGSAKYDGMPSSAIATGLVDYVLPAAELPAQLVAYVSGPYLTGRTSNESNVVSPEPLQKIFLLLRTHTGHDFSEYKMTTIRRRIERRMNVHQIADPTEYVRFLSANRQEIDNLFRELLISVTSFFRDGDAFETLAEGPLTDLLESRQENSPLRIWVPGCATGEEVFSIAILVHECMEKLSKHFDVQIFGTDLDSQAIETARGGVYPVGIESDVSSSRLERYFLRENNTYRIRKEIREMAVFAPQNVTKDPPFTKLDLICCRNLLIYMNSELQQRLLPIFHYALNPDGLLFLGPSESIGASVDLFETLDNKWKLFRRKKVAKGAYSLPEMPTASLGKEDQPAAIGAGAAGTNVHLSRLIERQLLETFCPACVVINLRGDIVYVHGRTGEFLELATGQARMNVVDMARKGLSEVLSLLIRQAWEKETEIIRHNVRVQTNGKFSLVDVAIRKIQQPEPIRGLLVLTFTPPFVESGESTATPADSRNEEPTAGGAVGRADAEYAAALQREIEFMRESNRVTQEELETSNEELKSTNEELQSTNEELQSTNEELETSKEEMQSLNEELTTVNSELQSKLEDLSQSNDDMRNLLNSTDIATVFLDRDLNIQRYTDQTKLLVKIRDSDIGRPLAELASNLRYDHVVEDCREVLKTLVPQEKEVRSNDDHWYLMRTAPYRTSENVIDGLVLTFVDITPLKTGEEQLAFFESIVDTVREPLVVLDHSLRIVICNQAFYRVFHTNEQQSKGERLDELGNAQWDVPELRRLLDEIIPNQTTIDDFMVTANFPKIGQRSFILNARKLVHDATESEMILLAIEEVIE